MPSKQRRYALKTKEARQIIADASETTKLDLEALFGAKVIVEVVEGDEATLYLIGGKPLLYKADNKTLPTLHFTEFVAKAPRIIVDMGAVPYVCKGATVMAPGIVRIDGEFGKGDLVVVADMKHGKALGLGETLMNAETARQTKKGPIVKTLHFVSDKIWDNAKTVSE